MNGTLILIALRNKKVISWAYKFQCLFAESVYFVGYRRIISSVTILTRE